MNDSLSILMLAHNKADYTRRCLEALPYSTYRPLQIVLVNNGSTDETAALFSSFREKNLDLEVEILSLPENAGAIVGRNLGMQRMRGDYWVFLDNDIVVRSSDWLEQLKRSLQFDLGIGVIGPKLVYPQAPHLIQCAGCEVTPDGQVVFRGRGEPRDTLEFNRARDCQTLISACWMIPRMVAEKVGPLDERFSPVQFEDIDYCYRIRESGWRCVYKPTVEMYHFENVTTGRTGSLNYPYLTVKNGLKFKEKWRHRFSQENGPKTWSWKKFRTISFEDLPESLERI